MFTSNSHTFSSSTNNALCFKKYDRVNGKCNPHFSVIHSFYIRNTLTLYFFIQSLLPSLCSVFPHVRCSVYGCCRCCRLRETATAIVCAQATLVWCCRCCRRSTTTCKRSCEGEKNKQTTNGRLEFNSNPFKSNWLSSGHIDLVYLRTSGG